MDFVPFFLVKHFRRVSSSVGLYESSTYLSHHMVPRVSLLFDPPTIPFCVQKQVEQRPTYLTGWRVEKLRPVNYGAVIRTGSASGNTRYGIELEDRPTSKSETPRRATNRKRNRKIDTVYKRAVDTSSSGLMLTVHSVWILFTYSLERRLWIRSCLFYRSYLALISFRTGTPIELLAKIWNRYSCSYWRERTPDDDGRFALINGRVSYAHTTNPRSGLFSESYEQ
jgi:hypothetical protein